MLDLTQAKSFLKLDSADTTEDALLSGWLLDLAAAFRVESKRRWAVEGEPALMVAIDPEADPVQYRFVSYIDPTVLSPDEQRTADQWLRFTLGHWYENRQTVAVGLNLVETPETANKLMKLLREPTL